MTENYRRWDIISFLLVFKAEPASRPIKLDILCCSTYKWMHYPTDFDVNLLVENSNSIHVRPNLSHSLLYITNRVNVLLERCKNKRFALVDRPRHGFHDVLVNISRAENLVRRGWQMDDSYIFNLSYILSEWKFLRDFTATVRTGYSEELRTTLREQNQCSICHEHFKDSDVIFNSCCNHNFHFHCTPDSPTQKGGIYHWFVQKQEYSCPCCRQDAVHFSFI